MRTLIVGHGSEEKEIIAQALSSSGKPKNPDLVFEIQHDVIEEEIINRMESLAKASEREPDANVIFVATSWPVRVKCLEIFDKVITVEDMNLLRKETPELREEG